MWKQTATETKKQKKTERKARKLQATVRAGQEGKLERKREVNLEFHWQGKKTKTKKKETCSQENEIGEKTLMENKETRKRKRRRNQVEFKK